jgi:hypothetical protein
MQQKRVATTGKKAHAYATKVTGSFAHGKIADKKYGDPGEMQSQLNHIERSSSREDAHSYRKPVISQRKSPN